MLVDFSSLNNYFFFIIIRLTAIEFVFFLHNKMIFGN